MQGLPRKSPDELGGHRPSKMSMDHDELVYGGFKAVLQGDHLGVEFGISAHVGLLQSKGLLQVKGRLVSDRLIRSSPVYDGLVIDGYFTIAPCLEEKLLPGCACPSRAKQNFDVAKKVYLQQGLAGSDHKDVVDSNVATVVGAQIDSRPEVVSSGILPVGAPAHKRPSLSWLAARAARFPCATDGLHSSLLGALVSAFCFRKSSMSFLVDFFTSSHLTSLM